jgi:transposase
MKFEDIYGRWQERRSSQAEAAWILGMRRRSLRRWRDRYEEAGPEVLLDRRLGKVSARQVPVDEVDEVLTLYRERYPGFTAKHFHHELRRHHGFQLSYSWAKGRLQDAGLAAKAPRQAGRRSLRHHDHRTAPPGACRPRRPWLWSRRTRGTLAETVSRCGQSSCGPGPISLSAGGKYVEVRDSVVAHARGGRGGRRMWRHLDGDEAGHEGQRRSDRRGHGGDGREDRGIRPVGQTRGRVASGPPEAPSPRIGTLDWRPSVAFVLAVGGRERTAPAPAARGAGRAQRPPRRGTARATRRPAANSSIE